MKLFDIDIIADLFLNIFVQLRVEKLLKYNSIFELISCNPNNELMDLGEFYLLMRHINNQYNLPLSEAKQMFYKYCNVLSENKSSLTIDQLSFVELCE